MSRFPLNSSRLFTLEIAARAALSLRGSASARQTPSSGPVDLFLCVVDHYEPQHGRASKALAMERLEDWIERYPKIAGAHRDSEGRVPAHGFFYPWDEYDEEEFVRLVELCRGGWGEIELHLHHRDDTEATLRQKIRDAVETYRRHGALSEWPDGRPAFSFIHGDWALNNSRSDGGRNWCGVNDEIRLLQSEGCYADFTFPAWKQTAQPRMVNALYYAQSSPSHPKGHDRGEPARAGGPVPPGMLMVQGPLVPYAQKTDGSLRKGVDDGDLAATFRYRPERLDRWVRAGIHVQGKPDRVFIKLHSHGAPEANRDAMLGGDLDALFSDAESRYNDGTRYRLHYVSPREMFNVIRATVEGIEGSPGELRDYLLPPPTRVAGGR
ncbi:MAG: hypothetical protein KY468_05585 [Armatimonadetes bacterium]|nr:hypothetical protein [Armatimonadota bacterium]